MKFLLLPTLALALLATVVQGQQTMAKVDTGGNGTPPAAKPAAPAPPANLSCQELTGRITDPFAYPLTGATIMLRTPAKGFSLDAFSTNAEGHYIITSKQPIPSNTVMEISAVGYVTLELPLADCRPLDITMTPLESPQYNKLKVKSKKGASGGKAR